MKPLFALPPIAFAAALLASCGQPPVLHAEGGYVQLPAVPGGPAAAYFTLKGGEEDNALISVTAPLALRAELHRSMTDGGMASMAPLARLPVPARGEAKLEPGGAHVMLFGLDRSIQPGSGVEMILTFERGPAISYAVNARAAGETPAE